MLGNYVFNLEESHCFLPKFLRPDTVGSANEMKLPVEWRAVALLTVVPGVRSLLGSQSHSRQEGLTGRGRGLKH